MKVRKKPVVVEAYRWIGKEGSMHDMPEWLGTAILSGQAIPKSDGLITIETLSSKVTVWLGDYIIQGIEGELYPCKPSIFNKTYEIVEED